MLSGYKGYQLWFSSTPGSVHAKWKEAFDKYHCPAHESHKEIYQCGQEERNHSQRSIPKLYNQIAGNSPGVTHRKRAGIDRAIPTTEWAWWNIERFSV